MGKTMASRSNIIIAAICAALFLTACGPAAAAGSLSPVTEGNNMAITEVTATADIAELEDGLSIVRFDGDDDFDEFLERGGASSDSEVASYLANWLLGGNISFNAAAIPFACSTLSVQGENGERLFGRNFDWYNCDALIVESHPTNGYASISTVNTDFIKSGAGTAGSLLLRGSILTRAALYAPLDGMNEKGLSVAVLMIEDGDTIDQNSPRSDITTTTAVRLLLNKAADVGEAVQLLESYDLHASFGYMVHLAIADASGKSVVAEYIDNELTITETPIVTNYYLASGEKYGVGTQQSHTRFETLRSFLDSSAEFTPDDVREALQSVGKQNFNDGETTEWSIVFNQTNGEAWYSHRENFESAYHITL